MPELPEVETIRRYLDKKIIGKTISKVDILEPRSFHGNPDEIIGAIIMATERKGKILTLKLAINNNEAIEQSNNLLSLNIHLKLTGQILFTENVEDAVFKNEIPLAKSNKLPARTTRVIIYFNDNSALFFNDMRKFGWIKVSKDNVDAPKGIDVLSKEFSLKNFRKALSNTHRVIKTVLLDQNKIAGIGNIYANDSLWKAKIHPEKKTHSLTDLEIQRLFLAINEIINEGIQQKGSSAKDELYILPDSEKGNYQNYFKTYHRHGKECLRCGAEIKRITLAGRGTFYCPECQKL